MQANQHNLIRASAFVESELLKLILSTPIGDSLPSERDLANQFQINRQPVREALQRLSRDGWLQINHGKSTTIRDYKTEGGLSILDTLARQHLLDQGWVGSLLEVRAAIAPTYTAAAIENNVEKIDLFLADANSLNDSAEAFTEYDWQLHRLLTIESRNPIYPMLLNSFEWIYYKAGFHYFSLPEGRESSLHFYNGLRSLLPNSTEAELTVRKVMKYSIDIWQKAVDRGDAENHKLTKPINQEEEL